MKSVEQLRAKYTRIEAADKSLRAFLTSWKVEHGVSYPEISEILEGCQLDAECEDLTFRELAVEEILKDALGE